MPDWDVVDQNPLAAQPQTQPQGQQTPADPWAVVAQAPVRQPDPTGLRGVAADVPYLASQKPWDIEKPAGGHSGSYTARALHDAILAPTDVARGSINGIASLLELSKDWGQNPEAANAWQQKHLSPEQLGGLMSVEGVRGAPAGGVAPKPAAVTEPRFPAMQQRLQDFDASGITPNIPALAQKEAVSSMANAARYVPIGGQPVISGIEKNIGEAARRSEDIAGLYGNSTTAAEASEALEKGREQFKYGPTGAKNPPPLEKAADIAQPTRKIGFVPKSEALYDRIPIDPGSMTKLGETVGMLENLQNKYPSNTEFSNFMSKDAYGQMADRLRPGFREVQGPPRIDPVTAYMREPVANDFLGWQAPAGFQLQPTTEFVPRGGLSWNDLKNFRSEVGRKMTNPQGDLGVGQDEWKALYGAISRDMEQTAGEHGPDAVKAWNRANDYYSAGLSRLNDAMGWIDKAAGKTDSKAAAELASKATGTAGGSDIARLQATWKSLPDEFRDEASSYMIRRLGEPVASQAGNNAANFSIGSWATRYAQMSPQAKDVMFGAAGTERRDALEALSRSMTSLKNVERLGNPSGSARIGEAGGSFLAAVLAPITTAKVIGGTYAGSRLLMEPSVARWIANASKTTSGPGVAERMRQLAQMAAKDPRVIGPYFAEVQKRLGEPSPAPQPGSAAP